MSIYSEGKNYASVFQNYGLTDVTSWASILRICATNIEKNESKGEHKHSIPSFSVGI